MKDLSGNDGELLYLRGGQMVEDECPHVRDVIRSGLL